jgi:serine phosphatase RsbU (regulator of sigma subunit)
MPVGPLAFPNRLADAKVLDSDTVYVVDSGLKLVECDEAWDRFARENGGILASALRRSVLEGFSGSARTRWASVYEKLLSGEIPGHSERFVCPSPTMLRTFRLMIHPRHDDQGRVVQLVHRTRLLKQKPAGRKDCRPAPLREVIADGFDPSEAGVQVAAIQRPLEGIGGDLIWERRHHDGRRIVVLADVMGHGDLAGCVADLIRGILDGLPPASPGEAVRMLNDEMVRLLPDIYNETMFATGLYLDLNPACNSLRVSNFAHFGLLFSEKGMIDPPGGLPVGLFEADEPWPEMELSYSDLGHRLMAYTDGIVEQFDMAGTMFSTQGLLREFLQTLPLDLKTSLHRIMSSVDLFRGEALIKDDQTLLAIELGG